MNIEHRTLNGAGGSRSEGILFSLSDHLRLKKSDTKTSKIQRAFRLLDRDTLDGMGINHGGSHIAVS